MRPLPRLRLMAATNLVQRCAISIRKRKVATYHGVNSDQTLKRKKIPSTPVVGVTIQSSPSRRAEKGENKEALPRKGNAG
eukprot:5488724-Pyramimonas_sp.AAC.1